MIRDADRVQVLIVAVDRYQDERVPEVPGAVHDAVALLRWCAALGVPWEQITLHVPPGSPLRDELDRAAEELGTGFATAATAADGAAGRVRLRDASSTSVKRSVHELINQPPGSPERLFVFLLGHGLQLRREGTEQTRRVFLTEDYAPDWPRNIAVEDLADTLLYTRCLRQATIVFDACSEMPVTPAQRQLVVPGDLGDIPTGALNAVTGMTICSSSGQLQRARDEPVGARGSGSVFLSALLDVTDPDRLVDRFIDFDGDLPVLDLRAVMEGFVIPHVRAVTRGAQVPEMVPLGANAARGVIPLYVLDRAIDRERFLREKQARAAYARSERGWVEAAFERRRDALRVRGLHHPACHLREAAHLASLLPDDPDRAALADALLLLERDLRSTALSLHTERWEVPHDLDDELRRGVRRIDQAAGVALADGARPDPVDRIVRAADRYVDGALYLRMAAEGAYATAVWHALRTFVSASGTLDADSAMALLGLWVAVSDGPLLAHRAGEVASSAGAGEQLGTVLLDQHVHVEHLLWWIRRRIGTGASAADRDLVDRLGSLEHDLKRALAAGASRHDAVRRTLDAYPLLAESVDRAILEALVGRATRFRRWKETG